MARPRSELEFGSDSFLDVLANIVGILIILIVIASAQLSRIPKRTSAPKPTPATDTPGPVPASPRPAPPPVIAEVEPEPEPLGPDEPDPEVAAQLAALEREMTQLGLRAQQTQAEVDEMAAQAEMMKLSAAERLKLLKQRRDDVARQRAAAARVQKEVLQAKSEMRGVLAEFEVAQKTKSNVKELKHTLTPISQMIEGPELHFRLAENKVAVIPLEELVGRLKTQIERQKEWLAKHRHQEGSVGPINGFTMLYLIEARSLSAFEELRHGGAAFRIGVSTWEIVPEPDLEAENGEQALRRGSKFAKALNAAPTNTSLTMWVYPDSFGLFRKLQAAAHEAGFVVSGRPLPIGAPIAGSPKGSRSVGQ